MPPERPVESLRASPPPTRGDARKHYFETLADDSLRTVLRFLSRRPQHENWHAYISLRLVNTALDVGGALARAALVEFHSIGARDGVSLYTTLDASILRSLVYRLPLHRLALKLDLEQVLPDLLRGCGADLREVVVDARYIMITEADIHAIATHCTRLSSLTIRGHRVEDTLAPIWRSLGPTLTRINICFYYSAFGHGILHIMSVPDLVQHCQNLRRVDVLTLSHGIADVLVSLGTRIRVLGIGEQLVNSIAPWHEVYAACTNLQAVHLELFSSTKAIDVLSLMRTKLASLTLYDLHNVMPTGDRFFAALSACSRLRKVEFRVCKLALEELRKLFESLKSVTTMTCAMGLSYVNPDKNVIDLIAGNVTNLEALTILTDRPLKGEDVAALPDLPRLKSVTLRPRIIKKSVSKALEDSAVEVVKAFKDCAQLAQLDIDDINLKHHSLLIAEAAVLYDRKDFDMFIGGVQYRTW